MKPRWAPSVFILFLHFKLNVWLHAVLTEDEATCVTFAWLKRYAKSLKDAGSIPDEVIIF
jgi:hypothetical protein